MKFRGVAWRRIGGGALVALGLSVAGGIAPVRAGDFSDLGVRTPSWGEVTVYVAGELGHSNFDDETYAGGATAHSVAPNFDGGVTGAVSAGYRWFISPMVGLRLEGEIGWHKNDVDTGAVNGVGRRFGGDLEYWSYMANIAVEIRDLLGPGVTPLLGVGVGAIDVDTSMIYHSPVGAGIVNGDDTAFAYQAFAAVEFDLGDDTAFYVKGRYLASEDLDLSHVAPAGGRSGSIDGNVEEFSISVGLRLGLGGDPGDNDFLK